MSLLRGWLKPDHSKLEERFIDLEGAPYDGKPGGENLTWRVIRTPSFKANAIIGLFLGAGLGLCASQPFKQIALFVIGLGAPYASACLQREAAKERIVEYPSLANVVIDRSGRSVSEPTVMLQADDYLRRELMLARYAPFVPAVVSALWTFANVKSGAPAFRDVGLEAAISLYVTVPLLSHAAWVGYAQYQLGQRRWTLTAKPPAFHKEARELRQSRLAGFVAAPIRALPGSTSQPS